MVGRGRLRAVAAWVVSASLVVLAVPVSAMAGQDTVSRLEDAKRQLDGAKGGLDDADRKVRDAREALESIEAELNANTEELERVQGELAEAQGAYEGAQGRSQEVAARLRAVDAELVRLEAERVRLQKRMNEHAATTYMHGGGARTAALYSALLGAGDLHDLSVGVKTVESVLSQDNQWVEESRQNADATARTRREVAALRAQRVREEQTAKEARDRASEITQRQETLTAQIAAQREQRSEILRSTESDRATADALVRQLQDTTAQLNAQLQRELAEEDGPFDGDMPAWAARLPSHGRKYAPAIVQAARNAGIEPRLLAALVWAESSFRPGATSRAGAIGLTQLLPETAERLGVDPHDPLQNLDGGARYLAEQIARFGSLPLGLAAYNAGPGAVGRKGGIPDYVETQFYVLAVMGYYQVLRGS